MKLLTLTTALALSATTAMSEGINPEPKPPVVEQHDSGTDYGVLITLAALIVGIAFVQNQRDPHTEPRPMVEPDMCMDKLGVWGACHE